MRYPSMVNVVLMNMWLSPGCPRTRVRVHSASMEFYRKAFFVVLAAVVGYALLLVLQPFAGSLTWAIFLAFILYPVHRWITRKFGGRAGISAGVLTALTPFALLIPLVFLGIVFANQARALVDYIKES